MLRPQQMSVGAEIQTQTCWLFSSNSFHCAHSSLLVPRIHDHMKVLPPLPSPWRSSRGPVGRSQPGVRTLGPRVLPANRVTWDIAPLSSPRFLVCNGNPPPPDGLCEARKASLTVETPTQSPSGGLSQTSQKHEMVLHLPPLLVDFSLRFLWLPVCTLCPGNHFNLSF